MISLLYTLGLQNKEMSHQLQDTVFIFMAWTINEHRENTDKFDPLTAIHSSRLLLEEPIRGQRE